MSSLTAISPIDGRYHKQTAALGAYFSEFALIRYRVWVEVEYFIFLAEKKIFKLPARRFLLLMKEVVSGSETGKRLIQQIVDGIEQMLNNQEYEETMSQFEDDLETLDDETNDDDLKSWLNSLGVDLSNDEEDDEDDGGELVPAR